MSGAWEITALRENRILLAIIVPPDLGVSLDFAQDIAAMQLPPGSNFLRVVNLPFGPARNQAAKTALENGYHLAFLDADVRAPRDAFQRLLDTKLDIVGGLYYQRFPPFMPVMFNQGRDDKGNPVRILPTNWKPGDLVPVDFLPSGLTLYRRRLLEAVFSRFPRPFEWGHDIAPVPSESGSCPPFSEDFVMSWRCKQLGFQPYCHTGIVGLHEVKAVVGPKWMIALPSPDPLHGSVSVVTRDEGGLGI